MDELLLSLWKSCSPGCRRDVTFVVEELFIYLKLNESWFSLRLSGEEVRKNTSWMMQQHSNVLHVLHVDLTPITENRGDANTYRQKHLFRVSNHYACFLYKVFISYKIDYRGFEIRPTVSRSSAKVVDDCD